MAEKRDSLRQVGAALAAPVVVLLLMMLPLRGGFTDDGFIHIQYANNIIHHGEYAFNPGEVSFGTTSPLWVLLLAALGKPFGGGESLIALSRMLSWVFGFASLALAYLLARSAGASRLTSSLAVVALAADAWFARWTALGMETSAAVFAMLLVALATVRSVNDRRWAALSGVFLAIAALVRPEMYLALPVLLAAWLTLRSSDGWRNALLAMSIAALLIVPWLVFAKLHIGSFLPNTAGAKSGGMLWQPMILLGKFSPVAKIVGSTQAITFAALVASIVWLKRRSVLLQPSLRFVVAWIIALPIAYVVLDIQILSRYLLLVTPLVAVCGVVAIEQMVGRRRWGIIAPVALLIAINAVFYATVVLPPSRAFSHDLTHELRDLGLHLREHSDEDAVVAAADIGYLAFYSGRRVLDLGGLVEPKTGELRSRYSYEEIMDLGLYFGVEGYPRVDYVIDRVHEPARFDGLVVGGHRFRKDHMVTVRNLGIRKPGPFHYTLYRTERVEP